MSFMDLATTRYSCRDYTSEPVSDEDLQKILDAAIIAPSACNLQPYHMFVCKGESLEKIQSVGRLHGAPLAIIVCDDKESAWKRRHDGENFGIVDCTIAVDHMVMQATELGLGTVWIGAFKPQLTKELLNIADPWYPQLILLVGHIDKSVTEPAIYLHDKRKSKEAMVTYL